MTSKDIAIITGKEHKNVLADIRNEIESIEKEGFSTELIFQLSEYKDSTGRKLPMYSMGRDGAMQIATRYSAVIRMKLIKKIDELENKSKNPKTYLEALKQLVISEEARIEAERKNAILMHVNKTYTVTEVAKECNLKSAAQLNKILSNEKIQYKSNGTWVTYSKYSGLGYFDIKQQVMDNGKVIYHRKITQLGRDFILNLLKES
jgi:Rha family phage regulatory protein